MRNKFGKQYNREKRRCGREGVNSSNQVGKKGMGTLDNIYMLNFLINRQIRKKRRKKLIALFVQ